MIRGQRRIGLAGCRHRQSLSATTTNKRCDSVLRPATAIADRPPARPGLATGIVTGLITAAVALGVGQLVAGIIGPQGSPVVAVGGAAIDLTPPPLKNFAISAFGSNDKAVLVTGILVLLAVFAAAIGVAAFRRFSYGVAGLAVFTGIGLAAALTRPTAAAGRRPALAGRRRGRADHPELAGPGGPRRRRPPAPR